MFKWRVYVDFDYQGIGTTPDFSTVGDDISSYVMNTEVESGGDFNEVRPDLTIGKCTLTLDNRSKVFDISNTTGKYYGKLRTGLAVKVELRSTRTGLYKTWFLGIIQSIAPDSGLYRNRQATITCEDMLSVMQASLVDIPLVKNVVSSVLARHILNACFNAPKAMKQIDIPYNPVNGQYIELDGKRITFVTVLSGDNQVVIGSNLYETLDRYKAALNGEQGGGTTFSTSIDRSDYILAGHSADFYRIARDNGAIRIYMLSELVGSTANDVGSNLVNATLVGGFTLGQAGVGFPTVIDSATLFNGSTGYLNIPAMDMNRKPFSIGFWLKASSLSAAYLFDIHGGAGGNWSLRIDATGKLFVDIDGVNLVNSGSTLIATNTPYYVTVTQDYFGINLYLNAVLVGSVTTSTMFDDSVTTSFTAAARSLGAGNFFNGTLEKLHFHFLPLTQGSIKALYNSRYVPSGIVATYRIPGTVGNATLIYKSAKSQPTTIRSALDAAIARKLPTLWFAQDESSGTTAFSKGLNSSTGTYAAGSTLAQASLVAGEDGYSVNYDGITGYLQLPTTLSLNGVSYTFEFVFRVANLSADYDVFHVWVAGLPGQSILLRFYTDTHFALDYAGGGTITTGVTGLIPNISNHMAIRHDVSTGKSSLWLNGTKIGEASTSGFTTATIPAMRFMYSYVGTRTPGRGQHFVHYARALTDAEILENATAAISSTLLGGIDYPSNTSIQTGLARFEIAADQWSPITTNGLSAMTNVTVSEVGRFYQRRDGTLVFENRDSRFLKAIAPPTLTLHNEPDVLTTVDRSDTYSSVAVSVTPRDLDDSIGVVAVANDLITVPGRSSSQPILPGGSEGFRITNFDKSNNYQSIEVPPTVIELQYLDPVTKRKIGVHKLIKPLLAGTDWFANEFRDYTGYDYTFYSPLQLDFTLVDQGTSVKVYITNKALGALYIKLQVRGYKVTYYDPITVTKENPNLINAKTLRNAVAINIPLGGSNTFAAAYASYLLNLFSVDRQYIKELDFGAQLQIGNFDLLDLEIGNTIKVYEDQTSINGDLYEVTGVKLSFSGGGDGETTRPDSSLSVKVRRLDDLTFGIYDNFTNVPNTLYDQAYYSL